MLCQFAPELYAPFCIWKVSVPEAKGLSDKEDGIYLLESLAASFKPAVGTLLIPLCTDFSQGLKLGMMLRPPPPSL